MYRGLADNTVGMVICQLLPNELILIDELGFAPLHDTGSQLLFRFVAAAYEHRSFKLRCLKGKARAGMAPALRHLAYWLSRWA